MVFNAVAVEHHETMDAIDCIFAPNGTGYERMIKLKVIYDYPLYSIAGSQSFVINNGYMAAYDQFVFVQPPL